MADGSTPLFRPTPSRYRGVRRSDSPPSPWRADITVNGKHIRLGSHRTEEDAARAYDKAARRYHGEFAHLNFPEGCE